WQSFGPGFGSLYYFGCTSAGNSFKVTTQPGVTYYVQAGTTFGGSAQLQLNIQEIPPPANDAFANAKVIDARPFVDPVDLTSATTKAGEPTPRQAFPPIAVSAWDSFTPDVTETVMARVSSCCVPSILAVYTGGSVNTLTEVRSRSFDQPVSFEALAGTTYYLQVGRGPISGTTAEMSITLEAAPPPVASF